jgi:hypothetical protein
MTVSQSSLAEFSSQSSRDGCLAEFSQSSVRIRRAQSLQFLVLQQGLSALIGNGRNLAPPYSKALIDERVAPFTGSLLIRFRGPRHAARPVRSRPAPVYDVRI